MYKIFLVMMSLSTVFINLSCSDNSTGSNDGNNSETTGTVSDIDGNSYKTVKIGDQWWMAENLKVTRYRNGDAIPFPTDSLGWANTTSGAYGIYENNNNYLNTYGFLYNWFAAIDNRNIAPDGWHVATDEDWKELEIYLGMDQADADRIEWRGLIADQLREVGTEHWGNGLESTNESGFTALPGGLRLNDNRDLFLSWFAFFWSPSTQNDDTNNRQLSYITNGVKRFIGEAPQDGMSIRCVKD